MSETVRKSVLTAQNRAYDAEQVDPDAPVRGARDRQWDVVLAIVVGGIMGAEARLGLGDAVPHTKSGFPWSTLYINVIGSLLIGILMVTINELTSTHRLVRPLLGIGVLGGFTTFSTFTVDTERLLQDHRPGTALLYVVATLLAAAAAVAVGTIIAQLVGRKILGQDAANKSAVRRRGR